MPSKEEDLRACALEACHRVGMYLQLQDPNDEAFLSRAANEVVVAAGDICPVGPPYSDLLMTFRQRMRHCLEGEGYTRIRLFLQRLYSIKQPGGEVFTWRDFCKWHVSRIRR